MTTATFPEPDDGKDGKIDVFALLRVSTDAQDIERQRYELEQLQQENNLNYVEWLELHGISGTAMLTNKQVRYIKQKFDTRPDIHGAAASSVDRVYRPQRGADFGIIDMFQDNKKILFTLADGIIDFHKDDAFERMVSAGSRAGKELREIKRRSVNGKMKNAKAGFLNAGAVPYGFRAFRDVRDRNMRIRTTMRIEESEAAIVVRIFDWAMLGLGAYEIAKRLNLEGVPSKRAGKIDRKARDEEHEKGACTERKNSGKWSQVTIWQILTQPAYMGTFFYHKGRPDEVKIACPVIIGEAVWQDVQLLLPSRKQTHAGRSNSRHYELTGLGWCKFCGHRLTTSPRPFPRAYYCCGSSKDRKPGEQPPSCAGPLPFIDKDDLQKVIWDAVWGALSNEEALVRMIELAYADEPINPNAEAEAQKARNEVAEAKLFEQRAHDNMRDPRYPRQAGFSEWEEAQRKLRDAEFRLAQLEREMLPRHGGKPAESAVRDLAKELAATEPKGFEERRAFLRAAIQEFFTDGKTVEILLSIPADLGVRDLHTQGEEKEAEDSNSGKYAYNNLPPTFVRPPLTHPITFSINALLR